MDNTRYTRKQILEDPECEVIRNEIKELIRNQRYEDAILYIQRYLICETEADECN